MQQDRANQVHNCNYTISALMVKESTFAHEGDDMRNALEETEDYHLLRRIFHIYV